MKKLLSVILTVTIILTSLMSTTALAITETEGAKETKIYFEVPELWGTPENVYCHIYSVYGGKEIKTYRYQDTSTKCVLEDEESNLYSFDTSKYCLDTDTSGYAIDDNADYGLIFSAINSEGRSYATCNLTFGSHCIGDTVFVTGSELSGEDDARYKFFAEWKNNSDKYGEMANITSIGDIVGEYFPVYQSGEEITAQWLGSWAVLNEKIITTDIVKNICAKTKADPQGVYDTYSVIFAKQLANIENTPNIASLERIGVLVGLENLVYLVAGSKELCTEFYNGDPTQVPYNVMTKVGDVYKKTFKKVKPCERIEFKIVEYDYDNGIDWIGDIRDMTFVFAVVEKCDVTITYNLETKSVEFYGDHVELVLPPHPFLGTITVAGNGNGNWLNGVDWDINDKSNAMTELEDKLYEITFEDVEAGEHYQFKLTADGTWADNWGGVFEDFGVESDAVYNSNDNIAFNLAEKSDVKITFDLRDFNYATKQGAKFKIDVYTMGDVNKDGVVNVVDATKIMKYSAELIDETEINLKYADVNGDGIVNVTDATAVQKALAGIK